MATITISASKDAQLNQGAPTSNTGAYTYFTLVDWSGGAIRGIIAFPLTALPPATIISATLSVYYVATLAGSPPGKTVYLYKVRRNDWVEGDDSAGSGVTWNKYNTTDDWGTAGAGNTTTDIDTSLSDSLTMPAPTNWLDFDVLDIVEDAVTNSLNVNVLLKYDGVMGADTTAQMAGRIFATTNLRPKLVIEYTPNNSPLPSFRQS